MDRNQFVALITNWYSKLTWKTVTAQTTATQIATLFLDFWVMSWEIPSYLLTENRLQFVWKFSSALCSLLGFKKLKTAVYHLQTIEQAESCNCTVVAILWHSVAKHHHYWDLDMQPLTCQCNSQAHHASGLSPFASIIPLEPSSATFNRLMEVPTDVPAEATLGELKPKLLHQLAAIKTAGPNNWQKDRNVTSKTINHLTVVNRYLTYNTYYMR